MKVVIQRYSVIFLVISIITYTFDIFFQDGFDYLKCHIYSAIVFVLVSLSKKVKYKGKTSILLMTLYSICCNVLVVKAQETKPIDYIDAGVKLLQIFSKSSSSNVGDCVYALEFNNRTNQSVAVEIMLPEKDSLVRKLQIPVNDVSSIFTLTKRAYSFKIRDDTGVVIKESEFLLKDCGTLKIKIE